MPSRRVLNVLAVSHGSLTAIDSGAQRHPGHVRKTVFEHTIPECSIGIGERFSSVPALCGRAPLEGS
jgi:hypothetical protein